MTDEELQELWERQKVCEHNHIIDHGNGQIECSDCGVFGEIRWENE